MDACTIPKAEEEEKKKSGRGFLFTQSTMPPNERAYLATSRYSSHIQPTHAGEASWDLRVIYIYTYLFIYSFIHSQAKRFVRFEPARSKMDGWMDGA